MNIEEKRMHAFEDLSKIEIAHQKIFIVVEYEKKTRTTKIWLLFFESTWTSGTESELLLAGVTEHNGKTAEPQRYPSAEN